VALKIKVVGLTGGIASGKSTVARFFRESGVPVLDADQLGHLILEPGGEAHDPVVERFGQEILDPKGAVDRQKLGDKVFGNNELRTELEAITHPAIAKLAGRGLELVQERGALFAIYEAALLVETGVHKGLNALIVVSCSVGTQLQRLAARDNLSDQAAALRIASQYPLEEKLKVADYVIENEKEIDDTKERTIEVIQSLKERFAPRQ
jgi:dephospho-CoA kinase